MFNPRISDLKGLTSPPSESNYYFIVLLNAFEQKLALNPASHSNAYYAYTSLHEHWVSKLGLSETFVTDNGTEFIKNESINFRHVPNAPWSNAQNESMNRSQQNYLRCSVNGNDKSYTECSGDVKLFLLASNSQFTTIFGLPLYELVFERKQ